MHHTTTDMPLLDAPRSRLVRVLALALLIPHSGCKKEDHEVHQYEAVKDSVHSAHSEDDGHAHTAAPGQAAGDVRLLGAITQHADRMWFFKMMGPRDAVDAQSARFHDFVLSLTFTESAEEPVTWTLPEGWSAGEGNAARYATITMGDGDGALELSVTALPGDAGGVMANINRWRGQIGLAEIGDGAELRSIAHTHEINGRQVIELDMSGPGAGQATPSPAPVAPFAQGGSRGAPPATGQSLGEVIEKTPADSPITYTVPEGWRQHEASGFRKAAFSVGPEEAPGVTTIIDLTGTAGGVLANVNRWRNQVGLPDFGAEEFEKTVQKLEVDGHATYYVDLDGPETDGEDRQRILGAIILRDERTWFVKMNGPSALLGREKEHFESLLRSIRFR